MLKMVLQIQKKEILEHNPEYYFDYVNDFNYIKDAKISDAKKFFVNILKRLLAVVPIILRTKTDIRNVRICLFNIRCAEKAFFILGESNILVKVYY